MGHPGVVKAKKLARVAFDNGWKGSIEHDCGITILTAHRDVEKVTVQWDANTMSESFYHFMSKTTQLYCAKAVLKVFEGQPDIMTALKYAAEEDRQALVEKYRKVPFDWENEEDHEIISKLVGAQIFWYSRMSGKIYSDWVLVPKGKKNHIEIKRIKDRKALHYIGSHAGFASVMLDTIVKVGK